MGCRVDGVTLSKFCDGFLSLQTCVHPCISCWITFVLDFCEPEFLWSTSWDIPASWRRSQMIVYPVGISSTRITPSQSQKTVIMTLPAAGFLNFSYVHLTCRHFVWVLRFIFCVDWGGMVQDNKWQGYLDIIKKLLVPLLARHFLSSWATRRLYFIEILIFRFINI